MNFSLKYFISAALIFIAAAVCNAQYDRDAFFYSGRRALSEGKYSAAIDNFNILARLDSTDHWTFFYRGIAKYNLGDVRGARNDFNTSIRLNPIFTSGYHYRGITESRYGEYDKALADIDKAISLRPGYEGLYFSRGVTYFLSRQFDKAVKDFDKYIRKQPKDPSAYLNRGASYLFLGDTTKALSDYNKAIKLDRYESEGFIRRGRLYASSGDYDKAIADMNQAINMDSTNTYTYFNRALMYYETKDYNRAMKDLNRVLKDSPGNALTLYNRSLISAQVGNFEDALSDMDRVININPKNVLAYYNRASFFVRMERWQDALEDYDKAIELYPDFAKAYMNRSYVKNKLGQLKDSKKDYDIAQQKIRDYREKNATAEGSFADTTKKYSALLSFDADFAQKDFNDEMLQHRDVDIRLKPLYRFAITDERGAGWNNLSSGYDNVLLEKFLAEAPVPMQIVASDTTARTRIGETSALISSANIPTSEKEFLEGLHDVSLKQYNSALNHYNKAVSADDKDKYVALYHAFYLMNRSVLRSDMIDFISSIESNVQTLTMDDKGTTRARVKDQVDRTYDYSEALEDLAEAAKILPDLPYIHFNLGNLYCLSSRLVEAVGSYDEAIRLYPSMGNAYFNRGLVLIYLKDKEKGCIDMSHAGELGVAEAYSVISKYCEKEENL